jgi:hypothetical protein
MSWNFTWSNRTDFKDTNSASDINLVAHAVLDLSTDMNQKLQSINNNSLNIDIGTVNAYAILPTQAITSYTNGMTFLVMISHTNTSSSCTLSASNLSVCPIYLIADGSILPVIGEIILNNIYTFTYNNGAFILQ